MYSNVPPYPACQSTANGSSGGSVLSSFPSDAAHSVVVSIVKTVSSQLGLQIAPTFSSSSSGASESEANNGKPSSLRNESEILWFMEVVCHGLSLPLVEHDTIKDCVNIYCEWLSALLPQPKPCVPDAIVDEPNRYARKIIGHLYHLFVPRKGEEEKLLNNEKSGKIKQAAQETIHKQAVLCHRVLRRIQDIVQQSQNIDRETWEALLAFLLAINDALLAPPAVKDDVGDQLCERVLGVLYEIWLVACVKCFPSPPLWKTFREMCMNWRHRTGLVDQWNRINLALTARLLTFMYGPDFPEMKIADQDANLVPEAMTNDCIAQSWYRFIHSLGNPVDLSRPNLVSQTQHFYQYAIVAENVIDPTHHPCLAALPGIFLKAMKGISAMVDAFLGIFVSLDDTTNASSVYILAPQCTSNASMCGEVINPFSLNLTSSPSTPTPPYQRRNLILGGLHDVLLHHPHLSHFRRTPPLEKTRAISLDVASHHPEFRAPSSSFSSGSGLPRASQLIGLTRSTSITSNPPLTPTSLGTSSSSLAGIAGVSERPSLSPVRPKVNSILHPFGKWLFEASFIGTQFSTSNSQALTVQTASGVKPAAKPGPSPAKTEKRPSNLTLDAASSRRVSTSSTGQHSSVNSIGGSANGDSLDLPAALTPERFESGRAEALGALCRIFCSKKSGEDIMPIYLARFYLAVQQGLEISADKVISEVLAMILVNSYDLLQLDLDGVHILLPSLVTALEAVLAERDLKLRPTNVHKTELRRAGIHLLISILGLSTQFENLAIKEMYKGAESTTFMALRPRIINLSINAIQVESDPINTHLLLGGLMFLVQDTACFEASGQDASIRNNPSSPESAHSVFIRATYLVCHRLISSWKSELNTSLAALELLGGLARIKLKDLDPLECKRAVKWICDYIIAQCSRPPPAHSRDLHSSIVAAFSCLRIWLLNHSYLLKDKECIATVMEVVEQGISGSKSQNKASDDPIFKGDKVLSPASRRVKDAAEAILTCILEQVDSSDDVEALSSLLDESSLLEHCNSLNAEILPLTEAVQNFRYLVVENSTIMAILEEPLGNDQEPQPNVTVLFRSSFGRSAWTLQLRQLPRHKSGTKPKGFEPGRPLPMNENGTRAQTHAKFFPDSIDRIPLCKADKSIPAVESVAGDERTAAELDYLSNLMEQQTNLEEQIVARNQEESRYETVGECQAPEICTEFQTARLILSHLGLLNMHSLRDTMDSAVPRLIALENDTIDFVHDLEALDRISPRTADTVHIFYCKSGQRTTDEILSNVASSQNVHPHFLEFLSGLGKPVNTWHHPGWTGHISTSWRSQTEPMTPPDYKHHGGGAYNGDHHVIYWSDAISEMAFVVPTLKPKSGQKALKRQEEVDQDGSKLDVDTSDKNRKLNRQQSSSLSHETKILIIWLERLEDHVHVPLQDLIIETSTGNDNYQSANSKDAFVIFLQPLNSGLIRVKMQGPSMKMSPATPLVDGLVISRRCMATLVRQTALNMAGRKRLELDTLHPPHVKRKQKVQEIAQKYRSHMTEAEFYSHLFNPPTM